MKVYRWLNACMAATMLVACGGGGADAGSAPFGTVVTTPQPTPSGTPTPIPTPTTVPTASDLVVETSKATVANTGTDSVTVKTTVVDTMRNVVAGAAVAVSADSDAIVVTGSPVTAADGSASSTITIGSNRANRVINVTVTSGAIVRTATIQVFGATLTGTVVPGVVSPGQTGKVQYRLLDQAGNAMVNQDIQLVATGLTPASAAGRTGTSGDFEFSFTAPSTPGSYAVSATAGGATTSPTPVVQVQATGTVGPATGPITSSSVSANPSVVGANAGSATTNRTEIRALFLGANNLPVQNVRVRFDLAGDANSVGGTFTSGTSTLYSNASGVVTTAYIPASRSSPTDGVTVRACYGSSDTDPNFLNCATSANVKLTVTSEPLAVSIGTDATIDSVNNNLMYAKRFIVSVVDAAGNAKPDVGLSVSVDLPRFYKGGYVRSGGVWSKAGNLACLNEDTNKNGVLEAGEDIDNDNVLEPRKSDVSILLLQSSTRADGTAELQIQYPKNVGSWIDAMITVSASGVSGTEGRAQYLLNPVPVDADSLLRPEPPAFIVSPYGTVQDCTNKN